MDLDHSPLAGWVVEAHRTILGPQFLAPNLAGLTSGTQTLLCAKPREPESFERYLELPTEIRLQVIHQALFSEFDIFDHLGRCTSFDEDKYIVLTRTYFPIEIAPFLLASKSIRQKALEVLARTPIRIYNRSYTLLHYLQLMYSAGMLDKVCTIEFVLNHSFDKRSSQHATQIANLLALAPRIKVHFVWQDPCKEKESKFPRKTVRPSNSPPKWQFNADKVDTIRNKLERERPSLRRIGLMLKGKSCRIGGWEYRLEDVPIVCLNYPIETEIFLSRMHEVTFLDDSLNLYMLPQAARKAYLETLEQLV